MAQVEAQGDSTQLHYIVTDLTGTARELCSEEGEIRWRGEQGLWGAHREERRPIPLRRYLGDAANEEVYCELRYQGQLFDAETGLYYNRHRYYDAESGQYLSPDPIGLGGGIRPQGYVHNPLEWVDPFGLDKRDPKINAEHVFHGEINKKGKAIGFHHRASIGHEGKARISEITSGPNSQGVYRAKVEVFDKASGSWVNKGPESSFFPDSWSRQKVMSEIRGAYNNGTVSPNGK
nr:RHS repeat-associated core domain-containing protein [Pectobacterium brasiliense]